MSLAALPIGHAFVLVVVDGVVVVAVADVAAELAEVQQAGDPMGDQFACIHFAARSGLKGQKCTAPVGPCGP